MKIKDYIMTYINLVPNLSCFKRVYYEHLCLKCYLTITRPSKHLGCVHLQRLIWGRGDDRFEWIRRWSLCCFF